jgi:hypothetical protein
MTERRFSPLWYLVCLPAVATRCFGSNYQNQDRWVLANSPPSGQYASNGRKLYYVDLAANEPECHSNTVRLERVGWDGLCIEANPTITPRIRATRNCTLVEAPIAANEREVTFMLVGEVGGIVDRHMDHLSTKKTRSHLTMKSRRFEEVLESVGAPRVIDYLSLDVEGAENEVLSSSFPFDRYIFLLMTIEQPPPPLNARLLAQGYLWVKNVHDAETFFVTASQREAARRQQQHFPPSARQVQRNAGKRHGEAEGRERRQSGRAGL